MGQPSTTTLSSSHSENPISLSRAKMGSSDMSRLPRRRIQVNEHIDILRLGGLDVKQRAHRSSNGIGEISPSALS